LKFDSFGWLFQKRAITANARTLAALLAIGAGAAGLSLLSWLEQSQQREIRLNPSKQAPDYLITQARFLYFSSPAVDKAISLDKAQTTVATLEYELTSETLEFFEPQARSLLSKPKIRMQSANGQQWQLSADEGEVQLGHFSEDQIGKQTRQQHIHLEGSVNAAPMPATGTILTTDQHTFKVPERIISSKAPVEITLPTGIVKTHGMRIDLDSHKLWLTDHVRATYQAKH